MEMEARLGVERRARRTVARRPSTAFRGGGQGAARLKLAVAGSGSSGSGGGGKCGGETSQDGVRLGAMADNSARSGAAGFLQRHDKCMISLKDNVLRVGVVRFMCPSCKVNMLF
ncbi:hypothetical protein EJB05_27370 [Eragrostis curvula]|uniref:Uncharacterized protein n=1 Tax=Eragrostis curvula TaxID=38414 RepID=A0A5J9UN84_9POAL|nr:hypothetical protein EJB05_27370 [Eragrostis curvula]